MNSSLIERSWLLSRIVIDEFHCKKKRRFKRLVEFLISSLLQFFGKKEKGYGEYSFFSLLALSTGFRGIERGKVVFTRQGRGERGEGKSARSLQKRC